MKALALIIVFCWLSTIFITAVGSLRVFRDAPPSPNKDENKRRMMAGVELWRSHLKAITLTETLAGLLLALVVLLG